MLKKLKRLVLGYRTTSESYIDKLKKMGVRIGEDVKLFRPYNTTIDIQNPHLLSIGSHVQITGPATILTHDYSWCVLKRKYGKILGNQKPVLIGDNVFIGWGATILAGTTVGNNVIIGANSVVSGVLESNSVYAGNPAKKIMSLDTYYEKRLKKQKEEATEFCIRYKENFGTWPSLNKLGEYFYLFTNKNDKKLVSVYADRLKLMENENEAIANLNTPEFDGYEAFIEYCSKIERGIKRS